MKLEVRKKIEARGFEIKSTSIYMDGNVKV